MEPSAESEAPEILALLGDPFLAYVCATSDQKMAERTEKGIALGKRREEVLGQLVAGAHQLMRRQNLIAVNNVATPKSPAEVLSRLCIRASNEKEAFCTALRRHAGGSILDFSSEDPLLRPVLEMAQDFYPILLLPQASIPFEHSPFPMRFIFSFRDAPAVAEFIAALNGDESLRSLFPEGTIDHGTSSEQLMAGSGRGSSVMASVLPATFLFNAVPQAWRSGKLTRRSYVNAVRHEVELARRLVLNEESSVRASIGFMQAEVPEDWRVQTPWGTLRGPNEWERKWAPDHAGVVLDVDLPMAIRLGDLEGERLPESYKPILQPLADLQSNVDKLRLALVLATPGDSPFALTQVWQFIPDPFQMTAFGSYFRAPLGSEGDLPDKAEVRTWCDLVNERHSPKLDLAMRRLLSALTARMQAEDGLVDAVVALESLFGTREGEIRFRLSVAVAWLLEAENEGRSTRQRKAKELYDKRSKIVHGGHLAGSDAEEFKQQAVQLLIEVMRTLFADRPELIADDGRGTTLALAGASRE